MSSPTVRRFLVLCTLCLGLAACLGSGTVEPTRFFLLDALPVGPATWTGPTVGVGPVTLPEYLDRPHLVLRSRQNEIRLADFGRWAAPLEEQISCTLAENLAALLGADRTVLFPWRASEPVEYQVTADVLRFDGEDGGDAVLNVRWALLTKGGKSVARSRRSVFTEKAEGKGYEALARAESRALQSLSREIAAAIREEAGRAQASALAGPRAAPGGGL